MAGVEDQQQNQTLQRLLTLVEAERSYHQRILEIIERLEGEMRFEQQRIEAPQTPQVENITSSPPPSYQEASNEVDTSQMHNGTSDAMGYFLGEVMFPYQADSVFELSISVGDYVVIREVRFQNQRI
ncbi:PREDICTED: SH3 domain-containing protein 2-like [Camelina sativa]|uniref:SH3 domain-containing protein 2-like n=1 Tax=Camelina sativa TaxID=90675 RepID=A0ABM0U5N7_CAMSA|nr:PREDICTED: SH3 domain-containing protein 2-like [Camelina sativa]